MAARASKASAGIQKAKDSARAAWMKQKGIQRAGSTLTLPALEARMRHAIPAGKAGDKFFQ